MGRQAGDATNEIPVTSSTPSELPEKQHALFHEVLSLLEESRQVYAVAGAFALREHTGICRFTKDLDIFLRPQDASQALKILQAQGFQCEVCDPIWLGKAHRDGYFVDLITGMSNGVISVELSWIERAFPATILGVKTRVLAPEELLVSKLFVTRRERFDGADIVHIIYASRGRLDWNRILALAGEHWELVLWSLVLFRYIYPAHTSYVPQTLWQNLIGKFAQEVRDPNPRAKFRGSLIDDAMFAIDVEEWGLDDLLKQRRAEQTSITPPPDAPRP